MLAAGLDQERLKAAAQDGMLLAEGKDKMFIVSECVLALCLPRAFIQIAGGVARDGDVLAEGVNKVRCLSMDLVRSIEGVARDGKLNAKGLFFERREERRALVLELDLQAKDASCLAGE